MNKKFSTLMAGLMLATAFSANAANPIQKYEANKGYRLVVTTGDPSGSAENVIAVVSNPENPNYGQLIQVNEGDLKDINAVKAATWDILFTQPTDGTAPKFTYINKATGLMLSVDPAVANQEDKAAYIKGGVTEWLNTNILDAGSGDYLSGNVLRSFYAANKVVYLTNTSTTVVNAGDEASKNLFEQNEGTAIVSTPYTELEVRTMEANASTSISGISIAPAKADAFALNADDLNSQLGKLNLNVVSSDQAWFNLYFNQDVTSGAETNLFAATQLKAKPLYYANGQTSGVTTTDSDNGNNNLSPYVRLEAKDMDGAYITVDTAYHTGTEEVGLLPKFTYAKSNYEGTNNVPRYSESSAFAFAYDSYNDRVLIKTHGYYIRTRQMNQTPNEIKGKDGNTAYTRWGYNENGSVVVDASGVTNATTVSDGYVRLAKLASVRELTVSANDADVAVNSWTETSSNGFAMATNVTLSQGDLTFAPTTIADGLYLIKLHTSGYDKDGNKRDEADGDYLIASLGGNFGYAEQAKRQNYDHMPAAQWLIQKEGTSSTAPIKIINREFFDQKEGTNNYFGVNGSSLQAFNAGAANRIFFTAGEFANDTLEFIPVSDASKKDAHLGYKYVDEEQASVETYYFNYLSGLSLDKGLNTPSDKDSLVRVDENGDKIALRLIPVVKDDSYGQQFDETKTGVAKLIRNAYYIEAYDNLKFAADGRSRYLSYEPSTKKYVMSLVPQLFFLKENNDADGKHYYALVEAETYGETVINEFTGSLNTTAFNGRLFRTNTSSGAAEGLVTSMYPAAYKGMSLIKDATKVWSFVELATMTEKDVTVVGAGSMKSYNALSPDQRKEVEIIFYDKDGEPIIADASEGVDLYAYMPQGSDKIITLTRVTTDKAADGTTSEATKYYAMNPINNKTSFQYGIDFDDTDPSDVDYNGLSETTDYASDRVSVDDNTLDLFIAQIDNIADWADELRVSAFELAVNDSPLYRRFNGAAPETYGTSANAPLNLKFFRYNNNAEYLFENQSNDNEYRDGLKDKSISFLGVNNAYQFPENETRSYTMFVDTAYVRDNTRMPQYLIGIRAEIIPGDTIWCNATSAHHHETLADSLACDHTVFTQGFTRAMYLFNAQDSIDAKNYDYQGKIAQGAQNYTRLAFKDAVHAKDTLFILNPNVTTEQLIASNLQDTKMFSDTIALGDNKHKNVVFSFRLINDENNRFLIESESEQGGKAVLNKDLSQVSIAPMRGGWVKIQNGVPVIAHYDDFNEAIAQAEIFDVNDEIQYDATANDEVAVESVKVIAGDGQVTIMGAAGKNVTITTVLGKTVVAKTIASDNETIAVPTTGIVAVAVEGEEAIMTIVK